MTEGAVRVGCSGWSYRDWRGPVYPRTRRRAPGSLSTHERFDTVELNNTFYRLPAASTVEGWAAQAPAGFCYAVKVGQFGSHRMKLRDPEPWLARHLERIGRLGPHLGPNLVQLPPRWKRDVGRLDAFLAVAPRTTALGRRAARSDLAPRRRLRDPASATAPRSACTTCWPTTRGSGPPRSPTSGSTDPTPSPSPTAVATGRAGSARSRIASPRGPTSGTDVYAYFNNDYDGHAVTDATWFRDRLRPAAVPR